MSLEITGKLVKTLPIESGKSKAGKEWKKQSFVVDTGDQYNPEVCFQLFGDEKIKLITGLDIGSNLKVGFNLSSREYNGKYYHSIDAWRVDVVADHETTETASMPASATVELGDEGDDLPFSRR